MRIVIAVVMALHGIAHGVGFAVPWRLVAPPGGVYPTTLLAGRVAVGEAGMKAVGVIWLLLGLGFVGASVAALVQRPGWVQLALSAASFSLMWTLVGWPEARLGTLLNVALIAALFVCVRYEWV